LSSARRRSKPVHDGAAPTIVPAGPHADPPQIGQLERPPAAAALGIEQQERHGANPDRVVAAFNRFPETFGQIKKRFARHAHRIPGKIPKGNGQFFGQMSRSFSHRLIRLPFLQVSFGQKLNL